MVHVGSSVHKLDAADPAYLLVEILETEETPRDPSRAVPAPRDAFRVALVECGDGLGASFLPAGETRGAALVDVSNWRSARAASDARRGRVRVPGGAPGGVNAGNHPAPPLRVEVTLAPAHDATVASALAGSGLDTFLFRDINARY